jgi:hypothetical protein
MSEDTTTTASEAEDTTTETAPETTEKEVDWKAKARLWESRAKENKNAAKELEELRAKHMTEQERAVAEAKDAGRKEALVEIGARLVDAEVKAAAAGRSVDVDALLDGLDRSKFLDDEGNPDTTAITAWIDRVAPKSDSFVDIGQGQRGSATPQTQNPVAKLLADKLGIPNP